MVNPLIGVPGGWELVLILFVIVLLFGAKKLPELTRSVAQSLNIFKQETKGLRDDDSSGNQGGKGGSSAADRDPRELPPASGPADEGSPQRSTERHDGTTG